MTRIDFVEVALDSLRINRLRSALTMLGVIIGVAAVIVLGSAGNENYVESSSRAREQHPHRHTGKSETKGGPRSRVGCGISSPERSDLGKKGVLAGGSRGGRHGGGAGTRTGSGTSPFSA